VDGVDVVVVVDVLEVLVDVVVVVVVVEPVDTLKAVIMLPPDLGSTGPIVGPLFPSRRLPPAVFLARRPRAWRPSVVTFCTLAGRFECDEVATTIFFFFLALGLAMGLATLLFFAAVFFFLFGMVSFQ
jgi:hypothetical protein